MLEIALALNLIIIHFNASLMSRFYNKYKNSTAILILLGYLFLFGYNIVHYHSYNTNFSSLQVFECKTEKNIINHQVVGLDFQCPVHSTYSSVHNSLLSEKFSNSGFLSEIELIKLNTNQICFNNQFYPSNPLRAPPSLIS
jgi:hypothetical protein